jgi:hypothetical protein
MISKETAFHDYLDALEYVLSGRMTIDEAVAHIEKIDGLEYAEIARDSLREAVANGKRKPLTGTDIVDQANKDK